MTWCGVTVAVEETRRSSLFQVSSSELVSKRRQQLERTILGRSALGIEDFSTPQARFREGYRKIPHESRKTSEMSKAKLFNDIETISDDVQALGRRRLSLFDEFNSLSYVESDDIKRISRQLRTYLPLGSSRYDICNSRYRLSKFS